MEMQRTIALIMKKNDINITVIQYTIVKITTKTLPEPKKYHTQTKDELKEINKQL